MDSASSDCPSYSLHTEPPSIEHELIKQKQCITTESNHLPFLQSALRYEMIPTQITIQFLLKTRKMVQTNRLAIKVYSITLTWSPQHTSLWEMVYQCCLQLSLPLQVRSFLLQQILLTLSKVPYNVPSSFTSSLERTSSLFCTDYHPTVSTRYLTAYSISVPTACHFK